MHTPLQIPQARLGGIGSPARRVEDAASLRRFDRRSRHRHDTAGFGRAGLLLLGIWLLGGIAVFAIVEFQQRVDRARHAQVVIEQMRNEQGGLIGIAFAAATAATSQTPNRTQTALQLKQAESAFTGSVKTLRSLGGGDAPARITALTGSYVAYADVISRLVATKKSRQAALAYGASLQPGGLDYRLSAELNLAEKAYGAEATRSRTVASFGTLGAIGFLLIIFSIAFTYSIRARKRSHLEANTDALTGLGNRRKLFADLGRTSLGEGESVAIGIFDLDSFKGYNDTFGHPAGDALLARLGERLIEAVGDRGNAYRIGGDEFVVVAREPGGERILMAAKESLSETGSAFAISCSLGTAELRGGVLIEEALHIADQQLYVNKRSAHDLPGQFRSEAKDTLLQLLTEQDENLGKHVSHVAALAESTATILGLPLEQIERARLAGELHDVGKAAIPASILSKPGPLTAAERSFIERHSEIGERIIAAAPSLQAIAPIVRSAHERVDGTGYPDRLTLNEIPIASRIIAIVDAYDAITTGRPYRPAISRGAAVAELRRCAGTQFDPEVVEAFALALDQSSSDRGRAEIDAVRALATASARVRSPQLT
jgi:diguanylate cyclase (GGDEF)-like protein